MEKLRLFWRKHGKTAALIVGLIGTPLAGGLYVITDHVLTQEVQSARD